MNKKLILIAAVALICGGSVIAQAPKIYKMGLPELQSPSFTMPYTTVKVAIAVERESIRKGPYARFAQKYLGVMAPLADKDIYTIRGAKLAYTDPERRPVAVSAKVGVVNYFENTDAVFNDMGLNSVVMQKTVMSHLESDSSFMKVAPDRMTTIEKSPEQMAKEAADAIFTLRKRRFDLVTGEAGENVFGAGMPAALAEIARLEQEYLSLFLGKQTLQTIVKEYNVVPVADKSSYIVARFSPTAGLVPDTDLGGRPIILMLKSEDSVSQPIAGKKDSRPMIYYRVADFVNCRLMDASAELAKERIPMYQFGATVEVPAPLSK